MFKTEMIGKGIMVMSDMKPCEIAVITDENYQGNVVMRTASSDTFEVMNLSDVGKDSCWTCKPTTLTVSLLKPGTKITLEVE